jgi:hypothetical protein
MMGPCEMEVEVSMESGSFLHFTFPFDVLFSRFGVGESVHISSDDGVLVSSKRRYPNLAFDVLTNLFLAI